MSDWRDKSLGELCRAVTGRDWQPIETAPKIGIFLVFLPNERRHFEVMYRSEQTSIVGGAFGFDRSKPTHWMPLPAPPSDQEAS